MNRTPILVSLGAALALGLAAALLTVGGSLRQTNDATAPGSPTTSPGPVRASASASAAASGSPGPFDYPTAAAAPRLDLVDQDGRPFDLASLTGTPVLVYFGYTHCPDVCPATVGVLNQVVGRAGVAVRAIIVTVDPERDTPAALREYLAYLPPAYIGLTGPATSIRTVADAWGVTYARIDTSSASGYAMAHTAEVHLVDAAGRLRAHYPFGTEAPAILADLARFTSR